MRDPLPIKFRRGIEDLLRPAGFPADRITAFLENMDDVYGESRGVDPPAEITPPLRRLQALLSGINHQIAELRHLDPRAADCIFIRGGPPHNQYSVAEAADLFVIAVNSVASARRRSVGRQSTTPRVYRDAKAVAQAFWKTLATKPTLARGGKYEPVLALVLEATTGKERGEDQIHKLAGRVLKDPEFQLI